MSGFLKNVVFFVFGLCVLSLMFACDFNSDKNTNYVEPSEKEEQGDGAVGGGNDFFVHIAKIKCIPPTGVDGAKNYRACTVLDEVWKVANLAVESGVEYGFADDIYQDAFEDISVNGVDPDAVFSRAYKDFYDLGYEPKIECPGDECLG